MGINVGTQEEEGTLAWFPVILACSHLWPLAAFLYHKGRVPNRHGCMFRTGSFSL